VRLTPERIAQVYDKDTLMFIPKSDVRGITLRHGVQAERPVVQFIFGAALLVMGLAPIPYLVRWLLSGGTASILEFFLVIFIPIGIWFCLGAFRRGFYLEVQVERETRKVPFGSPINQEDLQQFLREATELGYSINRI